ncbi:YDG domain-containing protein [Microbulbifer halophilus]|uniref:YDG domain-containing protein n=1 Tax=Microbulbifer halophilus TaxID=453963 RepID=A0ABW5EFZ2_9GAMM|nr:YDG domain-containing protein [Microbulbifer halophilus]MCW8127601.1 YDG domain-containing protein [Microbulbifer halophilus]
MKTEDSGAVLMREDRVAETGASGVQTPRRATGGSERAPVAVNGETAASPGEDRVLAGEAAVARRGAEVVVRQRSTVAVIAFDELSLGADATLRLEQPGAASLTVLVVRGGVASTLAGRLEAPGRVVLSNPQGVVFAPGAELVVAGLVAAAHELENASSPMASDARLRFGGGATSAIVENAGAIRTAEAGFVALVGPEVRQGGTIVAPRGRVALAACAGCAVTPESEEPVGFAPGDELAARDSGAGMVVQRGRIAAEGVDEAGRPVAGGGRIAITGGHVGLGGTVSVSGSAGGCLAVTSSGLLSLGERVEARGLAGAGGQVHYQAARVVETATARTDASGSTDGGAVSLVARADLLSSGTYSAAGASGVGGRIDMTAANVRLLSARLVASGPRRGGLVRIGGAFRGGKVADVRRPEHAAFVGRWGALPDLATAESNFFNDDTAIDVSSLSGMGGTAVIWSDVETTFLGGIVAAGKTGGGAVEISSAGELRRAQLLNVKVGKGQLLLDPKYLTVGAEAQHWVPHYIIGPGVDPLKSEKDPKREVNQKLQQASPYFGASAALNAAGTRLAVGAFTGDKGSVYGAVYLFSFKTVNFGGAALIGTVGKGHDIDVQDLKGGEQFGRSVALNAAGTRLVVGAAVTEQKTGAVYLFKFKDGDFGGGQAAGIIGHPTAANAIKVPKLQPGSYFGWSVALNADGTRLAVGAWGDRGEDNSNANTGAVHLFQFKDGDFGDCQHAGVIGRGYKERTDTSVDLPPGANFGISLALNGDGTRMAVGARRAGAVGAVYLFKFATREPGPAKLAARIGKGLTGPDLVALGELHGEFGTSVALNADGTLLAVGAKGDAGSAPTQNAGAVYVFGFADRDFGGGKLKGILGRGYRRADDVDMAKLKENDYFGTSVALNAYGTRMVVGYALTGSPGVYLFTAGDENLSGYFQYHNHQSQTEAVKGEAIAGVLAGGTAVTLQALNDITVDAPIDLVAGASAVAALTLQAGRSVHVNADILTRGGKVTLSANEDISQIPGASLNQDPGTGEITLAAHKTIDAGSGAVALRLNADPRLVNHDIGDITLSGAIRGGSIQVISDAAAVGKDKSVVLAQGASLAAGGKGDALVISAPVFDNRAGSQALSAASGRWLVWSVKPGKDPLAGLSPDFKQYYAKYGTTTPEQATGNGLLYSAGAPGITVNLTGEVKKPYDGNADAKLDDGNYTVAGLMAGETLSGPKAGTYDDKKAGTGKLVTVDAPGNEFAVKALNGQVNVYGYQFPRQLSGKVGTIEKKDLHVTGVAVADKDEDGSDTATVTNPGTIDKRDLADPNDAVQLVTAKVQGKFAQKGEGHNIEVRLSGYALSGADAGNYKIVVPAVTASIRKSSVRTLTVALLGAVGEVHKVYDGTTAVTAPPAKLNCELKGLDAADKGQVEVDWSRATMTFADKNVGTSKQVTVSGLDLKGAAAGKYKLPAAQVSGNIGAIDKAPLPVSGVSAADKVYDGTVSAALSGGTIQPLGQDKVTLEATHAAGTFASKNVGQHIAVTASGYSITGADAGNYDLKPPQGVTATITAKPLPVSGVSAADKIYDGTDSATLSGGSIQPLGQDKVTLVATHAAGKFASKDVGQHIAVTASGYTISGADAGNYGLRPPQGLTATIAARPLTATLTGDVRKVYDGTVAATLGAANIQLAGLVAGETLAADTGRATAAYADKRVGVGKPVTVSGLALGGAGAGNYSLPATPVSANIGAIDKKQLHVTGVAVADKDEDGRNTATVTNPGDIDKRDLADPHDAVQLVTAKVQGQFAQAGEGHNIKVTLSGYALSGADAENYKIVVPAVTASIRKPSVKTLTVTLLGAVGEVHKVYDGTAAVTAPPAKLNCELKGLDAADKGQVEIDWSRATMTFADKNVGTSKQVTVSGLVLKGAKASKYKLPATPVSGNVGIIKPAPLPVSGVTVADKVYDGTDSAALSGGTIQPLGHDKVTLEATHAAGRFGSKNAGTHAVTAHGYTLSGADAGNYALAQPTGLTATITKKALAAALTGKVHKVYDGNETAPVKTGDIHLSGVVHSETVTVALDRASAAFADKRAGTPKQVKVSGLALAGKDAGNYELAAPQVSANVGTIDQAPLQVSGVSAEDKVYDGAPAATLHGGTVQPLAGDAVQLETAAAKGTFATKDVGQHIAVTASGYTISGADAGNYYLKPPTTAASITPKLLTVTVEHAFRRAHQPNPAFRYTISGFVPGEDQTSAKVTGIQVTTAADANSHHGEYPIKASGGSAPNYTFKYIDGVLTIHR